MGHVNTVEGLREALGLQPHPEGGFYVETFRDGSVTLPTSALPPHFKVGRAVSTLIYYLMPSGSRSRLHRIPSAEGWHFYDGDPLTVFEIDDNGHTKHTVLGKDIASGQRPQYVVPPQVWFGAYPTNDFKVDKDSGAFEKLASRDSDKHYSLVGCTVAPGFQFEDFEMAKRSDLIRDHPKAQAGIEILTDPE